MAIAEDASTPAVKRGTAAATTTTNVTASFSPPAQSMLVVCMIIGWGTAPGGTPTLTCTDSVGGTYTAGPTVITDAVQCKIFTRFLSIAPGSMTITMTSGSATSKSMVVAARVLTGVSSVQTGAGSSQVASGSNDGSITTTTIGSWAYLVTGESVNATATVDARTTSIDNWNDTIAGDLLLIGRQTNATTTPGATTLGFTGAGTTLVPYVALELLPAASSKPIENLYVQGKSNQAILRSSRF